MKKIEILAKNDRVELLYEFDKSLPVASFSLVFRCSGSVAEKIPGLAKITANLLYEGTKSLPGAKFASLLETKAIDLTIRSGFETFVIEINCLKEHLNFALQMLKNLLNEPNFRQKTLEKLKTQTIGEILALKSDFDYIARNALKSLLFAKTQLGYEVIGTQKSISEISLKDIKEFFANLDISNVYGVLCGDVEIENFKTQIYEILETLPLGKRRKLPKIATSDAKKIKILKDESDQAYIYFGAPYNVTPNEYFKAEVAMNILGSSGFGSRLMEKIRVQNGLAYSIYASANFALSHALLSGYLQTKNENFQKALDLVKSEIENFTKCGVSEKELENAKKFLLGSVVLRKETMFKRVAILQNEYYLGLDFGEFDRNLERIKALELGTLNDFIKSHSEINELSFAILCGKNV